MARRPQVVVADEVGSLAGSWRITAFDDGWVDAPAGVMDAAQTRRHGVQAGALLLAFVGLAGLGLLIGSVELPELLRSILTAVLLLGLVAWLVIGLVIRGRWVAQRARRWGAVSTLPRVRHVPGSPWFRRASSARELAAWLDGVRLTTADQVEAVVVDVMADEYLAHVAFVDGSTRTYRSPSPRLATIFGAYGRPRSAHGPTAAGGADEPGAAAASPRPVDGPPRAAER